ncbi:MAG TPA: hypothetical protein VG452_03615 [Egibacteraceae bacterium]|nr:hypothetical protein [Egibacteraceae bacterium]
MDTFGAAGVEATRLAVHFHDTHGHAVANTLAALRRGVSVVDASAGGWTAVRSPGRRPATCHEDLVWLRKGVGVDTGVDLGRPSPSRVVQAHGGAF